MIRAVLLLTLASCCLASGIGYGKKSTYCYQCNYIPPKAITKTVYDTEEYEVRIPHTNVHCWYTYDFQGEASEIAARPEGKCGHLTPTCEHETTYEVIVKTRQVPRTVTEYTKSGGFEACKGPIHSPEAAKAAGVDDWECHDNCYVRKEADGQVTRGCYKHELNVNPNLLGCHEQAGATYCFCKGHHCNNGTPWR